MAIAPISSVSFRNNYNQVNFGGKKRERSNGMHVPMAVKSIPLAVIIAMSPMVGQAQSQPEKIVHMVTLNDRKSINPSSQNSKCEILFLSNDGNDDNIEIVRLSSVSPFKGVLKGYEGRVECNYTTQTDVNVLEIRNKKREADGVIYQEYYALGPGKVIRSMVKLPNGEWTGKVNTRHIEKVETHISKEVYEYLKSIMGDDVDYKTTNVIDNGSSGIFTY